MIVENRVEAQRCEESRKRSIVENQELVQWASKPNSPRSGRLKVSLGLSGKETKGESRLMEM